MLVRRSKKKTLGPWVAHLRMTVYKDIGKLSSSQSQAMNIDSFIKTLYGKVSHSYVDRNNRMLNLNISLYKTM